MTTYLLGTTNFFIIYFFDVDFKLENVLVSLHSLKPMCLGPFGVSAPLFLRNGELPGHSPIRISPWRDLRACVIIKL
jgi:hypothetical protein